TGPCCSVPKRCSRRRAATERSASPPVAGTATASARASLTPGFPSTSPPPAVPPSSPTSVDDIRQRSSKTRFSTPVLRACAAEHRSAKRSTQPRRSFSNDQFGPRSPALPANPQIPVLLRLAEARRGHVQRVQPHLPPPALR